MGLEDDIREIIKDKQDSREQERADLRLFEDTWESTRDTIIAPRLRIAVPLLQSELGLVSAVQRDNGGVVLHANARNESKRSRLWFAISKDEARKVACDSTEKEIKESFDIKNVTADEVDRKIREFVKAIA